MSEIAEIGEEEISIAENSPSLPRIERRASEGIGSLAGEEPQKQSSNRCGEGGCLHDESPIHRTGKAAKKMRHGRTDGQRSDQRPERNASITIEPSGHELERGG